MAQTSEVLKTSEVFIARHFYRLSRKGKESLSPLILVLCSISYKLIGVNVTQLC
ncbi:hypothetical protein THIOM_005568 [Candidatus Thiomargarita nelsonii]|uniref:Uncharacterized protein n=1 Tax=Candidatus Thiomargarita nelsonii TaxID=1003181 RepID=A0A176RSZ1_9GAMM|nr:hypothetical protein THIOM_005568 [Candidatus Thiomargarita nelsonii]